MAKFFCLVLTILQPLLAVAGSLDEYNGRQLMQEVFDRHEQYPYVYEEQSMITIDRSGYRNTRTLRRYSRVESDAAANFLLLFDSPLEIKGVALLAHRDGEGKARQEFYLPAFGETFLQSPLENNSQSDDNFLGTDYSIVDLVGEQLDHNIHIRRDDVTIDDYEYFVVDVHRPEHETEAPLRRHFVRKDSMFITRTDHFDELGRVRKRQTHHDLVNVHGESWRANMMMMDNHQQQHRTVIKIDRRVFSADYVPPDVFSRNWILANQAPLQEEDHSREEESP